MVLIDGVDVGLTTFRVEGHDESGGTLKRRKVKMEARTKTRRRVAMREWWNNHNVTIFLVSVVSCPGTCRVVGRYYSLFDIWMSVE